MAEPMRRHGSLRISNIIGAGLRIYRDRFSTFFVLAFKAHCWLLVPVYGWAKFSALLGQIARLVYGEVVERPETATEAYQRTDFRKWSFLLAGILVTLILFGATVGVSILLGVAVALSSAIASLFVQKGIFVQITFLLTIFLIIASVCVYLWLFPRLVLIELPVAIEGAVATVAIKRSWQLTKGSALRLLGIFSLAFALTLPLLIVVNIATNIIRIFLVIFFSQESALYWLLYIGTSLVVSLMSNALVQPFWQALKAIAYSDLRGDR